MVADAAGFIFFICAAFSIVQAQDCVLERVQVLFRHGDRSIEAKERYKNDPYDSVFKEYGDGQMTPVGMKREYKVGQMLRQRYNNFLGEYEPEEVYGFSTDIDRTKQSLQLALAGLYPPTSPKTLWNKDIPWFPIPTHYEPITTSFLSTTEGCQRYKELEKNIRNSSEILERLEKFRELLIYVKNETGFIHDDIEKLYLIHNNLRAALSLGLPLPKWCTEEHYKELQKILVISFEIKVFTDLMMRITVGPTIEHFLKLMNTNETKNNKKKIFLYAAHDMNVATFLRALNFTIPNAPQIPDYGSAVIMETLRGQDNLLYVQILYWTGVSEELFPVNLEGCSAKCPLTDFSKLVESVLPNDEVRSCFKNKDYENRH